MKKVVMMDIVGMSAVSLIMMALVWGGLLLLALWLMGKLFPAKQTHHDDPKK